MCEEEAAKRRPAKKVSSFGLPLTLDRIIIEPSARCISVCLFVCSSVRLSVKFVKTFATWQHLAASSSYRYCHASAWSAAQF